MSFQIYYYYCPEVMIAVSISYISNFMHLDFISAPGVAMHKLVGCCFGLIIHHSCCSRRVSQQPTLSGFTETTSSSLFPFLFVGAMWPDDTELLASSLAHLAQVIAQLNSVDHGRRVSLFAGESSQAPLHILP